MDRELTLEQADRVIQNLLRAGHGHGLTGGNNDLAG